MEKIPVTLRHPLNKIHARHGGDKSPGKITLPGLEDHAAAGVNEIYKMTPAVVPQPKPQPIRNALSNLFARKGNQ